MKEHDGRINTKELIAAGILTVIMAFMDITGLPGLLFINIQAADITPFYFTLMINFFFTGLVCYAGSRLFLPNWKWRLEWTGAGQGLKKYGLAGILALICSFLAFYIGLQPFDYKPTAWKVLIEGFIYYIGVGMIEELYVRGLLLNIIEKLFHGKKNAVLWAVVLSSVIFGAGHIPGALGSPFLVIVCKVVWTIGLGIYFGAVYKKTNCLWVAIILHTVMDFCGVPFCFSTSSAYPTISLYIILPVYLLLGGYGICILRKDNDVLNEDKEI